MGRNLKLVAAAALLAIAAVEFALLGIASTAGANDGPRRLPPVSARGARLTATVASTHAPAASLTPLPPVGATPTPPLSPPPVDPERAPAMVNIFPHPRSVPCDGETASFIETTWRDASGDLVPDGTWVHFWTDGNGWVDPYSAQTAAGVATTSLRFATSQFHQSATVWARSEDLVAGVQVVCVPVPCDGTESPPCPPFSPPPCIPSPGSGPMSPPCPSEPPPSPPDCAISPPSVSPPCHPPFVFSPFEIALQCDAQPATSYCSYGHEATGARVLLVIRNTSLADASLGAVEARVSVLVNPDAFEALDGARFVEVDGGWSCEAQTGPLSPAGIESIVRCEHGMPLTLAPGESVAVAAMEFGIVGRSEEPTKLRFEEGTVYGPALEEVGVCGRVTSLLMSCPSTLELVAPPVSTVSMALDCDISQPGIQVSCDADAGGVVEVGIVLANAGDARTLGAFNFNVFNPDASHLVPLPSGPDAYDSNPDFNEDDVTGPWICSLPPPTSDTGAGGPGTATSRLVCFVTGGQSATLPEDGTLLLATMRYEVPSSVSDTEIPLSLAEVAVSNAAFGEIGSCAPVIDIEMVCGGATIRVVALPTTAIAATTTAAPAAPPPTTPAATRTPQPEACAADVNGDGRVSIRDLRQVAHAVARAFARGYYDARYDVNGDGRLTPRDILLTWRRLGRRC
jgi:hypothetical protein